MPWCSSQKCAYQPSHYIHCQCAIIRVVLACWFMHVLHLSGLGLLKPVTTKKKKNSPNAYLVHLLHVRLQLYYHKCIILRSWQNQWQGQWVPMALTNFIPSPFPSVSVTRHIVFAFIPAWLVCQYMYNHVDLVNQCGVLLLYWIKRRSDSVATRRFTFSGLLASCGRVLALPPAPTYICVPCVYLWPHYRLVSVLHKPPSNVHTTFKLLPTSLPILNLKYSPEHNRIKCCYM